MKHSVLTHVAKDGNAHDGEMISTVERRRQWPDEEKLRIMREALAPGSVASAVADRNGVCRSLLYTWLRLAREERLPRIACRAAAAHAVRARRGRAPSGAADHG